MHELSGVATVGMYCPLLVAELDQKTWTSLTTWSGDPIPAAKRISTPVLILHGRADRQVPPKHAEKLAQALREGGNCDVTLRLVPQIDHLFLQDKNGNPAEYAKLTSRRIPGGVLDELAEWTVSRLTGGGTPLTGAAAPTDPATATAPAAAPCPTS